MVGEPSINFSVLYSFNFYLNLLFKIHIYKTLWPSFILYFYLTTTL